MKMLALAFRNVRSGGVRTWLNAVVLSLAFVVIIGLEGLYKGMYQQASQATIRAAVGGGQFWQKDYDPYDPLSLDKAHAPVPPELKKMVRENKAVPILVTQGFIYPNGRLVPVLLKGIPTNQTVLEIPTQFLSGHPGELPALIGNRMAQSTKLKKGDAVTIRWRDVNGTIDARDAVISEIMNTTVPTIDQGQIWLPLDSLQAMMNMPGEATLLVLGKGVQPPGQIKGWIFRSQDYLLSDIREMVQAKQISSVIFFIFLLLIALLAIFDTQVLSIFRRRREIGTLMALGMTRREVVWLFNLEGILQGVLALFLAAFYGTPLLLYAQKVGFALPAPTDQYGFALGNRLYPVFGISLVVVVSVIILLSVAVTSYWPTRRIARMKPTDALRGKFS